MLRFCQNFWAEFQVKGYAGEKMLSVSEVTSRGQRSGGLDPRSSFLLHVPVEVIKPAAGAAADPGRRPHGVLRLQRS